MEYDELMTARHARGFSLVELMVVVTIIGLLTTLAIPGFMGYIKKTKSAEAAQNTSKMYAASRSYVVDLGLTRGSTAVVSAQFPAAEPVTPLANCCTFAGHRCMPNPATWDTPTWNSLHFAMTDPHYYRYEYASTGPAVLGAGARFTARALGDLDCDGILSTFEMTGELMPTMEVSGAAGIFMDRPTE
jgi:type IV pilus assembly protein PilA